MGALTSVGLSIFQLEIKSIDLDGIREEANEKLTQLCWQTTFDRCQQTLVSFLVIMTDKFGRMRSTLAKVCSQASSTGSLPQKRKLKLIHY